MSDSSQWPIGLSARAWRRTGFGERGNVTRYHLRPGGSPLRYFTPRRIRKNAAPKNSSPLRKEKAKVETAGSQNNVLVQPPVAPLRAILEVFTPIIHAGPTLAGQEIPTMGGQEAPIPIIPETPTPDFQGAPVQGTLAAASIQRAPMSVFIQGVRHVLLEDMTQEQIEQNNVLAAGQPSEALTSAARLVLDYPDDSLAAPPQVSPTSTTSEVLFAPTASQSPLVVTPHRVSSVPVVDERQPQRTATAMETHYIGPMTRKRARRAESAEESRARVEQRLNKMKPTAREKHDQDYRARTQRRLRREEQQRAVEALRTTDKKENRSRAQET